MTNPNGKPTATQCVLLYVRAGDNNPFNEDWSDQMFYDEVDRDRLDAVAEWRARHALRANSKPLRASIAARVAAK